jgi:hypothetical protein
MKTSAAFLAACAGTLLIAQTSIAEAQPKPGKQTKATGQIIIINTGGSGGTKAKPRPPAQSRTLVNTSRSNIKQGRIGTGTRQSK